MRRYFGDSIDVDIINYVKLFSIIYLPDNVKFVFIHLLSAYPRCFRQLSCCSYIYITLYRWIWHMKKTMHGKYFKNVYLINKRTCYNHSPKFSLVQPTKIELIFVGKSLGWLIKMLYVPHGFRHLYLFLFPFYIVYDDAFAGP